MDPAYAPWIALACGIIGMVIGYFMGYRTGLIAGELAALKLARPRRDRGRGSRSSVLNEREQQIESAEELELVSRPSQPDSL